MEKKKMGCDIHIYTESYKDYDKMWFNCDRWKLNRYAYDQDEENEESKYNVIEIYDGRDYVFFGMLAGVRGEPLFNFDRGLPKDICKHTLNEYNKYKYDYHNPGYCTLKELKEKRKKHPAIKYKGYIPKEEIENIKNGKDPKTYAYEVNPDLGWIYCEWEEENTSLNNIISKLEEYKKEEFMIFDNEERNDYDDKIRIVFWFDS